VQDLTPDSPADRAGLRTYDLLVSVNGTPVTTTDELIRRVSSQSPGTLVHIDVRRDGKPLAIALKLAERPGHDIAASGHGGDDGPVPSSNASRDGSPIGLTVRDLDGDTRQRYQVPRTVAGGVVVTKVDPMSPAFDAEIERGFVLLEINRRPVATVGEYQRLTAAAQPGDVLAFYMFVPESGQRLLRAVRVDQP
jgi:serine protease Do